MTKGFFNNGALSRMIMSKSDQTKEASSTRVGRCHVAYIAKSVKFLNRSIQAPCCFFRTYSICLIYAEPGTFLCYTRKKRANLMSLKFRHETLGQRVLFGVGQAATLLAQEVEHFQANNVMVIAGETELAHQVVSEIHVAAWHHEVVMHVPIEVARRARLIATERNIDLLVSIGGGSTTGTAKAVSMTTGIPSIAVPTTYAGSEATDVWGLTEQHRKTTGKDPKVLPLSVIYDSQLMLSLPVELSVASGLNALAHCVDSYWAPHANPLNAALASEGVRAISQGLPLIVDNPRDTTGRDLALYGAYLSAVTFASVGSGLHHKLCHILGGTFNLPHA